MNVTQEGYILMTSCQRFLCEKNGFYSFVTDPFAAKFLTTVDEVNSVIMKSLEMWGELLITIPTERTITLLG
jgi:hypothetical protein